MTVRNLDALFNPKSIAVIGASLRAGSIGEMVWSRLSAANFAGPVWPVNPKHRQLNGVAVFAGIGDLPDGPPWRCCARHRPHGRRSLANWVSVARGRWSSSGKRGRQGRQVKGRPATGRIVRLRLRGHFCCA